MPITVTPTQSLLLTVMATEVGIHVFADGNNKKTWMARLRTP